MAVRSSHVTVAAAAALLVSQVHANLPLWSWDTTGQNGCGLVHDSGFNNDTEFFSLLSGNLTRNYAIYVPESYDPNTPTPLIFDYHGNQDTPWQQYDNSQYYLDDLGKDYLVVYPEGLELSWQGASYAIQGVNDLAFTTDLLLKIERLYCVDSTRVYASGKSNGGGFVDLLACSDEGANFAAFAMAAAALYTDTSESDCLYKRAIMESHGALDTTIPIDGGEAAGGDVPDIALWTSWWGERTCGKGSLTDGDGTNTTESGYETTTYSCGDWDDVIMHYAVTQLGHCWPSSTGKNYDALTGVDCDDTSLDFTSKVVQFFAQWNTTSAPSPS